MTKEVSLIEVSVGVLPDWYLQGEDNNDIYLEEAIMKYWNRVMYKDAEVTISYNYTTEYAIVKAYDEEGDLVFERNNHHYDYALAYVYDILVMGG